jgi:hypothetical protein
MTTAYANLDAGLSRFLGKMNWRWPGVTRATRLPYGNWSAAIYVW